MGDKRIRAMKISLKNMKFYLINFLFEASAFPVYAIVMYFLWKIIIANSNFNVDLHEITTYYILTYAISMMITETYIARQMSDDIRKGSIVKIISRPMTYLEYTFWKRFGVFLFFSTLYFIVLLIISFFFKLQITLNPLIILLFIISLILAMIMNYLLFFIIGITAFWTTNNWGVINAFMSIVSFLSGSWIPLTLLTGKLKEVSLMLPFKYTVFIPASILQGKLTTLEIIQGFIIMLVWIFIFYLTAKLLWRIGEKHLAGFGV